MMKFDERSLSALLKLLWITMCVAFYLVFAWCWLRLSCITVCELVCMCRCVCVSAWCAYTHECAHKCVRV